MQAIKLVASDLDFEPLHRRMQWHIDQGAMPGCSTLTVRGLDVVDFRCYGVMDVESARALAPDAIFRVHSNSKLITPLAVTRGTLNLGQGSKPAGTS